MKEYVDELLKNFKGTYLEFVRYVHLVLDKKMSVSKNKHKYRQIHKSILKYITDNEKVIISKIKKFK